MINEEFKRVTGMEFCDRNTNRLEDRTSRKDWMFRDMANLYYDDPDTFHTLESRIDSWVKAEHSERILALAGYVNYICESYERAADFFMEAIALNPDNLDTWLDLAFSFYHSGDPMGYAILFNYDQFITFYRNMGCRECNREILKTLESEICRKGLELSQDFRSFLGKEWGDRWSDENERSGENE